MGVKILKGWKCLKNFYWEKYNLRWTTLSCLVVYGWAGFWLFSTRKLFLLSWWILLLVFGMRKCSTCNNMSKNNSLSVTAQLCLLPGYKKNQPISSKRKIHFSVSICSGQSLPAHWAARYGDIRYSSFKRGLGKGWRRRDLFIHGYGPWERKGTSSFSVPWIISCLGGATPGGDCYLHVSVVSHPESSWSHQWESTWPDGTDAAGLFLRAGMKLPCSEAVYLPVTREALTPILIGTFDWHVLTLSLTHCCNHEPHGWVGISRPDFCNFSPKKLTFGTGAGQQPLQSKTQDVILSWH